MIPSQSYFSHLSFFHSFNRFLMFHFLRHVFRSTFSKDGFTIPHFPSSFQIVWADDRLTMRAVGCFYIFVLVDGRELAKKKKKKERWKGTRFWHVFWKTCDSAESTRDDLHSSGTLRTLGAPT